MRTDTIDRRSLPVLPAPGADATSRPVRVVVDAVATTEGAGFPVRRPFPGRVQLTDTDPFLMLDHMGPVVYEPGRAVGAPDHPHRGFETVTYLLDGEFSHRDSHGGGGVLRAGDTQWMTAGAGLVHSEMPSEDLQRDGGRIEGVQVWVNLPAADKFLPPRYQHLAADDVVRLTTDDAGAEVRLIAGPLGGHAGPGSTHTPVVYAHATITAGRTLRVPWDPDHNTLAYTLGGEGTVGPDAAPLAEGQLAVLGPGDVVEVHAGQVDLDVLLLGGRPLGEPIVQYGPFVMNTKAQIAEAIEDFQAGRMGSIPAG